MPGLNDRLNLIKRNTRATITLVVRKKGPISRTQIAKISGISPTCVSSIVEELIEEGVLIEVGTVPGIRGRQRVLLDIRADGPVAAGINLAPGAIELGIANPNSEILARRIVSYDSGDGTPEAVIDAVAVAIKRALESVGKSPKVLRGVGVAVHGIANPLLGIVEEITNRRGWEGVPMGRMLQDRLHVPVLVDNGVRAGALAFQWLNSETPVTDSLIVTVGDGVGSAVIQNQQILRGAHNQAGEIGHMIVVPGGPPCNCGNRGCLEALTSDTAFIRRVFPQHSKRTDELSFSERKNLVKVGFELAVSGDPHASTELANVMKYLGIGIANAVAHFDPQTVFVVGTLVDLAPEMVIDWIRREALQYVRAGARGVEIRSLPDIDEFLLLGAVGLVLCEPFRALSEDNLNALSFGMSVGKHDSSKEHVPTL